MGWVLPTLSRRARLPAHGLAEAALLAVVLGATLAFMPSDGTPSTDTSPTKPTQAFVPMPAVPSQWLVGVLAAAAGVSLPVIEAPIPTAAPAMILIPSINVHRAVEPVGVDRRGVMYQPQNLWNAGWYKAGPVPGAPGDAVIEGHAGYPDAPLIFGKLRQLRAGDKIVVVLADGSRRLFLVDSQSIWPAGTSPPGMGQPYGPSRLTLITCTGPFDDHYKTYADRLAVEATYAGLA